MDGKQRALDFVKQSLDVAPVWAMKQRLSRSGNGVYRVWLADGNSVCIRMSTRRNTFAFTARNLAVLRSIRCPVQDVLSTQITADGGSYIILSWLPGYDLIDELPAMDQAQITRVAKHVVELQLRVSRLPLGAKFGWAPIGRNGLLNDWDQVFGAPPVPEAMDYTTDLERCRGRLNRVRESLRGYFASVRPVCFLDDLTAKNLLVEDGNFSGIIDLDFVCYGDPLMAVGSTLAGIVADMSRPVEFYALELMRLWNPTPAQQRALWFYSALWMFGFLRLTDPATEPQRLQRLTAGLHNALDQAQANNFDLPSYFGTGAEAITWTTSRC